MASSERDSAKPILWIVICRTICICIFARLHASMELLLIQFLIPLTSSLVLVVRLHGAGIYWLGFLQLFGEYCRIIDWVFGQTLWLGIGCFQVKMGKKVIVRPKVDSAQAGLMIFINHHHLVIHQSGEIVRPKVDRARAGLNGICHGFDMVIMNHNHLVTLESGGSCKHSEKKTS